MSATHPVFVHASVNVGVDGATEIIDRLRAASRSQARELKSSAALSKRARSTLIEIVASLAPDANICLVDKDYFTCAKLIDLIVAEQAYANGIDLARSGEAAELARMLWIRAPGAMGSRIWRELLTAFNALIRRHVREGSTRPDPSVFFGRLSAARSASADPMIDPVLAGLWEARHLVAMYEQERDGGIKWREMDPMVTTLVGVARTWGVRLGGAAFEFLVDNYWGLDEDTRVAILGAASIPIRINSVDLPVGDLRAVRLADSEEDPRIQVADVLAGVGRANAELAREGVFDDSLQEAAHEALDFNGMWATGSALDVLCEQRPLRYFEAWAKEHLG